MDYFLPRPKRVYVALIFIVVLVGLIFNVFVFPAFLDDSIRHGAPAEEISPAIECNITEELALNAFERMKTAECKESGRNLYCAITKGGHGRFTFENQCPAFEANLEGAYEGCFRDSVKSRLLTSHLYDFSKNKFPETNSPETCVAYCRKAGYEYAGVEFGHECFCGYQDQFEKREALEESRCERYNCTGGGFCGGYEAIAVYRTGWKGKTFGKREEYVEPTGNGEPVKILFLTQLNGRDIRQFNRMLKTIYSPSHLYYVHVDARQDFLFQELLKLEDLLPNLKVTRNRRSTIWGGASLLKMFLASIAEAKSMRWTDWDFVLNMSESDMMILSLAELEANFAKNKGYSYLSSHGRDAGTFIQKQGFNFVFHECEERMWRIGQRTYFPEALKIDGGSDWIIISQELADFVLRNDTPIVKGLLKYYETMLLPLESFFHTVAANSEFCHKIVRKNLRITNWRDRVQGCRQERIKKVVDWGGCSPLVYQERHSAAFRLEEAKKKAVHFARKFDPMIDVRPIAAAEQQALRNRLYLIDPRHPSYNSTWINVYSSHVDGGSRRSSVYHKMGQEFLQDSLENVFVYKRSVDSEPQLILSCEEEEVLLSRTPKAANLSGIEHGGFQLKDMVVGMDFLITEEVFRDHTRLPDVNSYIFLHIHWKGVKTVENKTSPTVYIRWFLPSGRKIDQAISAYNSIYFGQYVELNLSEWGDGESGEVKVTVFADKERKKALGSLYFPIIQLDSSYKDVLTSYYKVEDRCTLECWEKPWSSRFPDPKSEIKRGYDSTTGWLK
ncbi:hypothetical protein L596_011694 [Steinernema carpocapsae]|uniref:protein xylosyltransferase n=1 Tax=Steinernema carpocapsae TaxID=34508 RepID=A0A4V6A4L6_STECR|nr:hypothetical protein L596_011694 [Steinernema carpocapsae]